MKPEVEKRLKIFFIAFIISLPFFWGANLFEQELTDFFIWRIEKNTASIVQSNRLVTDSSLKPFRNWQVENLKIKAKSAISAEIDSHGQKKVLFEKNIQTELPIASLSKLMTALVVSENYQPQLMIEISKEAANQAGEKSQLRIGESFYAYTLLYPMLIESSNGAAYALSEIIGKGSFVELMNLRARELIMDNTYFINPSGLDDEPLTTSSAATTNYSTTEDLIILAQQIIQKPELIDIISTPEYKLYSPDGVLHHNVVNTNELLGKWPDMIGGKTGYTEKAGECLLVIMKSPGGDGYLINIILASWDRFGEMEQLINWVKTAYKWQ